jgi:OmpA-OmpF porin, OOP family
MKTKLTLLFTAVFLSFSICATSQVIDPKKEAEKESTKRVNKKIDKSIDKGLDKLEEGLGGLFGKKKKKNKKGKEQENQATQTNEQVGNAQVQAGEAEATPALNWSKYDFVPGDKVIFEDNQENEENGEFPSRWDLVRGNVEMAVFGGENVIMFRDGAPSIIPYLKNSGEDYLPDVFTIEFDLYYPGGGWFETYLYDRKNQKSGSPTGYTDIEIRYNQLSLGQTSSTLPDKNVAKSRWMHIAIAYTQGKLKAYMDETRLLNIPRLDFDPKGFTLYTYHAKNDNLYYVKNVRIAEGGVKYYDRFLQDGKIIANGIRFDVNKATLRPESMGVINEIATLMKEHPEINFSVEGHTDSDGNDALNQTLSEQRAGTVVTTLAKMGIASNRLSSKGWGESKPLDTNDTPEGKANNRRVEFVKK